MGAMVAQMCGAGERGHESSKGEVHEIKRVIRVGAVVVVWKNE